MSIIVDCKKNKLFLKIVPGNWDEDLSRIKSIPGRRFDGESSSWEIDLSQIDTVLEKWATNEIIYTSGDLQTKLATPQEPRRGLSDRPPILIDFESYWPLKWYQDKFVRLNPDCSRVLLSLPQGAGKSLAILERIKVLHLINKLDCKRILVVCPKRIKTNWQTYFRNVLKLESTIYWAKTKSKRLKITESARNSKVVICTYETLKELHDQIGVDYDFIIVDEAHLLANPDSQRSRDFEEINCQYALTEPIALLTGTPIQDKIKDLWNLVRIVDPYVAGNRYAWQERYTRVLRTIRKPVPVKRNGEVQRDESGKIIYRMTEIPVKTTTQNLDELQRRLEPIMFRVAKEDIFDFEEVVEPVFLELEPEQKRLYEQLRDELIVEIEDRTLSLAQVPTRVLRLLQACEGIFNFSPDNKTSCKLDYLSDLIKETDEQVAIWSRFQRITFELQELFPDKVVIVNGAMSDDMNQLAIWAFNGVKDKFELEQFKQLAAKNNFRFGPGEAKVISSVIDIKSSLGSDYHEQGCGWQIFPSISLMPAANDQAAARITRQGQKKGLVLSQYLLCNDTIEPGVWSLVLEKWKTTLQILDGKDSLGYQQSQQLLNLLRNF